MSTAKVVRLPLGRLSFAKLKELQYSENDTKKERGKYSFNLIIPADADLSALKNAVKEAAQDKFGERLKALRAKDSLKIPFKSGSTMVDDEGKLYAGYEADSQVVGVNMYNPMKWYDQFKNEIETNTDQGEKTFYSGCWVDCYVTVHAYDQGGGTGVNLRCYGLMKTKDDEAFGGTAVGDLNELFGDVEAEEHELPANAMAGAETQDEEW